MTVAGTSNLPVAPRNTAWHASAAKQRVFEACDKVACIQRAFLWRGEGDPREPDTWSLGFCDVIDGRLHIVPAGIAACAGVRGIGSFMVDGENADRIRKRIAAVYARVAETYPDWPTTPFRTLTADASGTPLEGVIAVEGVETGDRRFIEPGALVWDEGPWPLVFDRAEMDHSGATVGTINSIERRERAEGEGNVIWATGALSDSDDPETQMLVTRAGELFGEGAVGVSISMDNMADNADELTSPDDLLVVRAARIRSVAIVDEAAFAEAKMSIAASLRAIDPAWFADPKFGNGSQSPREDGGDDRLVWQEPERPEEDGQFGCPLTVTADGRIYGHAALWGRCHVGYPGTCIRPPKEPGTYRGFLTGERIPGVATGPLVMKTRHAPDHYEAQAAAAHYDHTGYAPADVTIGPDAYGIWVSGALRADATEADIEILRSSALSGDWRPIGGRHRLVGVLAVNAPGFRVARAVAASGALITVGPGCDECDSQPSLEDRLAAIERLLADRLVAGLDA